MAEPSCQVSVDIFKGDENKSRGNWSHKADFILSILGFAVGLDNVWRFPYLAYESGGGAFLIPYCVMLLFAGLPIFFLEVIFAQYCSRGATKVWEAVPMMRGVGIGIVVLKFFVVTSYNILIAYCIRYLVASFTTKLPWIDCNNDWNTKFCSLKFNECIDNGTVFLEDGTCVPPENLTTVERDAFGVVTLATGNYSVENVTDPLAADRVRPSEEYWNLEVRREASSIGQLQGFVWPLVGSLTVAWIITFLSLLRGIKTLGKVVYFTVTLPYLVLLALFIYGLTLPGHRDGISFFISPDWEKVADPQIWMVAAVQTFYSLGAAAGSAITLASYNKFHNNCYADAIFVTIANSATNIFAGFAIFSIVGFMAHELSVGVSEVVDQGYGLAFIVYPEAIARLPAAPVWSILFFLMLTTLGLDSEFAGVETIVSSIVDEFPDRLRARKTYVLAAVCGVGYIIGLIFCTESGLYWVDLLELYGPSFSFLLFGFFECISLSWFYGVKRIRNDIRTKLGDGVVDFPLFNWWLLCWSAISPAIILFVMISGWANWREPEHNGPYPGWARAIGWLIILSTIIWIPIFLLYEFLKTPGSVYRRWVAISNPTRMWGPAVPKFRQEAWEVHRKYGTTMGGDLILDDLVNDNQLNKRIEEYENEMFEMDDANG